MSESREAFLKRAAELSFKYNDLKTLRRAVSAEIKERIQKISDVSGQVTAAEGRLQREIDNLEISGGISSGEVQTLIDTASGVLQTDITTVSGDLDTAIGTVSGLLETRIDVVNSDLLTRITALEQEVTRLQTELSLHENNGMHWTAEAIDQRAQALIDASSSN